MSSDLEQALELSKKKLAALETDFATGRSFVRRDDLQRQIEECKQEIRRLSVDRLIEEAVREGASKLNLSGQNLRNIPSEIAQLQNLTELNLSNNQLSSIPPEISQLQSLTQLYLSDNQLSSIPREISQLQSLKELDLGKNQLSNISPEISQLRNLTHLGIKGNQLSSIPPEISQLQNLTHLGLSDNQLSSIPPEISQLQNLIELYLIGNQLSSIPSEIAQLQSLTKLYIRNNQLKSIPPEIAQLQNLTKLDLSYNQLKSIPPEIAQLQNLTKLYLNDNPLPIPPEILARKEEPRTIINYYIQNLAEPSRPLNEAKVILVGEAKVGKTSLVKRLLDDDFDAGETMTEGINIREWSVRANDQTVKLNVWDFGGQEIMHATHQFFLTKRSLYLLVLDARQDEEANRIEYWLKIVRSFGGDSRVIVVGNQVDQKSLDIDRRGLQQKYPHIVSFIETSCSNNKGIDKLRREIKEQIAQLPHVFDDFPESWFAVKTQLEELDVDYIEYHEYQKICTENKVTDEQNQSTLISFLHDLGIALNFRDDPRLKQDSVLNPEWVTNGVYDILNDNALMTKHKGILRRSMLQRILDSSSYPVDKHLFILDIMGKFELCFPLEGFQDGRYLLPDLLSKEEPETGEWDETLPFQYHYSVLPGSIISRFIVRTNQLIAKNTYWRNGVVLEKNANKALVKADREDRKIFIWVKGNPSTRRVLLESIRDQFDYIHSTIPGIEMEEKVPLPSNPRILVDYKNLLDMEAMGVEDFVPSGLQEKIKVRDLLEGTKREKDLTNRGNYPTNETIIEPPARPNPNPKRRRGLWEYGLFYLFLMVVGAVMFVLISIFVPQQFSGVFVGIFLTVGIVGIFQLVQSGKIGEDTFAVLFEAVFNRLPNLRGKSEDDGDTQE